MPIIANANVDADIAYNNDIPDDSGSQMLNGNLSEPPSPDTYLGLSFDRGISEVQDRWTKNVSRSQGQCEFAVGERSIFQGACIISHDDLGNFALYDLVGRKDAVFISPTDNAVQGYWTKNIHAWQSASFASLDSLAPQGDCWASDEIKVCATEAGDDEKP
ncbi:hypothetical protein [Sphingobium phenoxybenzoativorans]|uniref:hypothetical protein n=1 Tax=Sphingobium phenoxybenzoativorans TaxID=1592790 RepID=UPI00087217E1|nr:hypothetical protein [Sphingobium phenoxybenzoativorans]